MSDIQQIKNISLALKDTHSVDEISEIVSQTTDTRLPKSKIDKIIRLEVQSPRQLSSIESAELVDKFQSAQDELYQSATADPLPHLHERDDKQILIEADDETFRNLCKTSPHFSKLCNSKLSSESVFEGRSIKWLPEYLNMREPKMSWKEFYLRVIKFQNQMAITGEGYHAINELLYNWIIENKIFEIKLLLKNKTFNINPRTFAMACRDGRLEIVKIMIQDSRVNPSDDQNQSLIDACKQNQLEIVSLLLADGRADPNFENESLRSSIEYGHPQVVKLLLNDPRVDPSSVDNEAIKIACAHGQIEIVKILLQDNRVDPSAQDNYCILIVCEENNIKLARLLLQDPRVDPSAHNNEAIYSSCYDGRLKIVKILLQDPRVDPSGDNNAALQGATENNHYEIVKLLLNDHRVVNAGIEKAFLTAKEDRNHKLISLFKNLHNNYKSAENENFTSATE